MHVTPPPVPKQLREMLKDYPEYIQRLQEALSNYAKKPFGLMPFDGAIWAIEGALGAFYSEARQELEAAEKSGIAEVVERASAKEEVMARALLQGVHDQDEVWSYFKGGRRFVR